MLLLYIYGSIALHTPGLLLELLTKFCYVSFLGHASFFDEGYRRGYAFLCPKHLAFKE